MKNWYHNNRKYDLNTIITMEIHDLASHFFPFFFFFFPFLPFSTPSPSHFWVVKGCLWAQYCRGGATTAYFPKYPGQQIPLFSNLSCGALKT